MLEKLEIVKCGPFRFIGISTYLRNKGSHGMHDNIWSYLWSKSVGVFKVLDEMKEYATDEVHDCVLYHWEKYCDKTELYGYTIGRLMKADTPVPSDMDYIDIPCDYIAKVFKKRKHDYDERIKGEDWLIKLEGLINEELKRKWETANVKGGLGGLFLTAEVYPKPDENGDTYIGCYEFGKTEG